MNSETVDHIDGDKTNNSIENLQVLSRGDNQRKSVIESGRSAEFAWYNCVVCSKSIYRYVKQVEAAIEQGMNSPCCSKRCVGLSDK